MLRPPTSLLLLLGSILLAAPLAAQADRYELGLRLRSFERRLEDTTEPDRRTAAYRELDRAVQAFFRLDNAGVAKAIDAADRALRAADDGAAQRFAATLGLAFAARLVPTGDGTVAFTVRPVYRPAADEAADSGDDLALPDGLVLRIEALPGAAAPVEVPLRELPTTGELPLQGVPEGDHAVRWSVRRGDEVLAAREQALSVVERLDLRMASLLPPKAASDDLSTLEGATLPLLLTTLTNMQRARQEETMLPGAQLLRQAEALASGAPYYGKDRAGDFLVRIPLGRTTVPARLFVPADAGAADRPLVIALHGAGGSENLFFDGYGDGKVVRLAAARGWYVVAPRNGFGGVACDALVDALASRWPIDRQRVVVVGHSMGAMQAMSNANRTPERFAAVAALGGGGSVRRSDALTKLPFLVGVGSRDFALGQARTLHGSLQKAAAPSTLREYPGVEHLAIVQVALDDVFAWFDTILGRTR
jgi:predicted esterase